MRGLLRRLPTWRTAGRDGVAGVVLGVQSVPEMAMVIADVPEVHGGDNAAGALFTLSVLTSVVMLLAGLLRAGAVLRSCPRR